MYGLSPETNGQEEEIRCEKETFGITSGERVQLEREKDQRELQILEDHKRSVNSSRNSLIQSYMNNQNNQSGESLLYQQNNRSVTSVTSSKNKSLPLPLHHQQEDQPLILQIHISPKSQFLGRTKQTHLLVLYQRHKLFQNTQTKEVQLCTVVLGFIIHQYFNQTTTFH